MRKPKTGPSLGHLLLTPPNLLIAFGGVLRSGDGYLQEVGSMVTSVEPQLTVDGLVFPKMHPDDYRCQNPKFPLSLGPGPSGQGCLTETELWNLGTGLMDEDKGKAENALVHKC